MEDEKQNKRLRKMGRKPKDDKSVYRYTVNLNSEENNKFKMLFEHSGFENISRFLNHAIFNKEIKVVKVDKTTKDYFMRLTNIYSQFQYIGNNYNQTVRAIKANFGDKRAMALLYKLEKATIQLVIMSREIMRLTDEFEKKWLQK